MSVGLNTKPCASCRHYEEKPSKAVPGTTIPMCNANKNIITARTDPKPAFEVRHNPKLCGYKARWHEKKSERADADLFA